LIFRGGLCVREGKVDIEKYTQKAEALRAAERELEQHDALTARLKKEIAQLERDPLVEFDDGVVDRLAQLRKDLGAMNVARTNLERAVDTRKRGLEAIRLDVVRDLRNDLSAGLENLRGAEKVFVRRLVELGREFTARVVEILDGRARLVALHEEVDALSGRFSLIFSGDEIARARQALVRKQPGLMPPSDADQAAIALCDHVSRWFSADAELVSFDWPARAALLREVRGDEPEPEPADNSPPIPREYVPDVPIAVTATEHTQSDCAGACSVCVEGGEAPRS